MVRLLLMPLQAHFRLVRTPALLGNRGMLDSNEPLRIGHRSLSDHEPAASERQICRFQAQARGHAEVLGRFERDLALLAAVAILPGAQTEQLRTLADLVPREQYCDWAAKCSACHDNLASKVGGRLSLLCLAVSTSPAMWVDCCACSACHGNLAGKVTGVFACPRSAAADGEPQLHVICGRQDRSAHQCRKMQNSSLC